MAKLVFRNLLSKYFTISLAASLYNKNIWHPLVPLPLGPHPIWRQKVCHFDVLLHKPIGKIALTWGWYLPGTNKILSVFANCIWSLNSPPSLPCPHRDQLDEMSYTTMCINESLRLAPPVPSISRELSKPITFPDGLSLTAGLCILFLSTS